MGSIMIMYGNNKIRTLSLEDPELLLMLRGISARYIQTESKYPIPKAILKLIKEMLIDWHGEYKHCPTP